MVVAQCQVGFAACLVHAALEDLEDQLGCLVAELAREDLQAFERRGLHRVEAVMLEHRADRVERRPAAADLVSQKVPGTRWRLDDLRHEYILLVAG